MRLDCLFTYLLSRPLLAALVLMSLIVLNSPTAAMDQKGTIQAQIKRIAQGEHQQLPEPTQSYVLPGQKPGWTIENATGFQLHLYLTGPAARDYIIPSGKSIDIDLPPGSYRIAVDLSSKSVLPYYSERQLNDDMRWKLRFYIASE